MDGWNVRAAALRKHEAAESARTEVEPTHKDPESHSEQVVGNGNCLSSTEAPSSALVHHLLFPLPLFIHLLGGGRVTNQSTWEESMLHS